MTATPVVYPEDPPPAPAAAARPVRNFTGVVREVNRPLAQLRLVRRRDHRLVLTNVSLGERPIKDFKTLASLVRSREGCDRGGAR